MRKCSRWSIIATQLNVLMLEMEGNFEGINSSNDLLNANFVGPLNPVLFCGNIIKRERGDIFGCRSRQQLKL